MNDFNSNDADAPWPIPLWAPEGYVYTSASQGIYPDVTFAPESVPAGFDFPDFDAANDMAFAPAAPTTSMGAFTNLPTQQDYAYSVSKQRFERRHGLTLLCYRMSSLVLGLRRPNVSPIPDSATILRVHRDAKLSPIHSSTQTPSPPSWQTTPGLGFLPMPPIHWHRYST